MKGDTEKDERVTLPADLMEYGYQSMLVRAAFVVAKACGIRREELAEALDAVTVKPEYANVLEAIRDGQDAEPLLESLPEGPLS